MKKIIGLAVVMAMVFAMLPFTVFAADTYYVAGESALCGSNWNEKDAKNIMTADGDVYKKVYTNVPAGKYQFKVTDGTWTNSWGNNGANYSFTLDKKCDVTITFDPTTKNITVDASGMGEDKFVADSITAVGAGANGFLNNASWDPAAVANHMTNNNGVWSITYPSVGAATYEFKFAANNSWSDNWGTSSAVTAGEWTDIYYNANNCSVTVDVDGSSVELILDLTAFDYATKNGAKVKVVVTPPQVSTGIVVDEGTVSLKSDSNSESKTVTFTPDANGTLTVAMGDSTPGWSFIIIYPDESSTLPTTGSAAASHDFAVNAGETYQVQMSAYNPSLFGTADGKISYKILFEEGGSQEVVKEEFIISETILAVGDNDLSMEANALNTLFEFTPDETGRYSFTAPFGVEIGNWGAFFNPVDNTANKTNSFEWECTSVGQSVLVGVVGSEDVVLTVTRTGDVKPPVTIEYVDYVNTHTPDVSNQLVLGEGESVQYVDITKPQTAVLGSDGFYHLGSANGPVLYLNMAGDTIDMSMYYYSGNPAITLRGQLRDEQGNLIAAYNFLDSLKAYVDACKVSDYEYNPYPLTEDLAIFLEAYGGVNGWFNPMFSPFEAVQNGCDADAAWLVACCYVDNGEVTPPEGGDDEEEPVTPDKVTIIFHYTREDGLYDGWNLWAWDEDGIATLNAPYALTVDEYGATVAVTFDAGSKLIGYIFRLNEWDAKDVDYNQFIDVSDVLCGTIHVFVTAGVPTQPDASTTPTLDELIEKGFAALGRDCIRDVEDDDDEDDEIEEKPLSDYIVAGSSGLCGSEWNPADQNNRMYDNGDGTYTIVFENVAIGSYEFKITKGSWDENWGLGGANGGNVTVNMEAVGNVTITFNPSTLAIEVNGEYVETPSTPPTGDVMMNGIVFVMVLASMSVVALVVLKKKFF